LLASGSCEGSVELRAALLALELKSEAVRKASVQIATFETGINVALAAESVLGLNVKVTLIFAKSYNNPKECSGFRN
jgi:anti-sigma regulatory factor (Ser/Thr protein kinase)